jgi:nucleoside-diphosphate-sugar epimerase
MRILVAGGAGYVGNIVIPRLVERGYDVEVVDLLWFGNRLPKGVKVRKMDILDLSEADLKGFDQVIFLAGLSNDPMADYSPAKNFVSNAACPAYLSYIAKRAGVQRYVYASSCSVYGYTENELYDEDSPTVSDYPYGISKLQGEYAAVSQADEHFSVIALRKGTICGYSARMRFDLVVNTMFKTAVTEQLIRVNNPAIWRPILAAQDAATAYMRAVEASEHISGVFNVASVNYTLGELADEVREGVREYLGIDPRMEILHNQDVRNYKVSFEKARNVLGFAPLHRAKDIVRELAEHKDEFGDYANPLYYNIQTFKALDRK